MSDMALGYDSGIVTHKAERSRQNAFFQVGVSHSAHLDNTGNPGDVTDQVTDEVLQRLKLLHGVSTDTELAQAIGQHKTTLHSWRRRGVIPYEHCVSAAQRYGASLDWIVLGRERDTAAAPAPAEGAQGVSSDLAPVLAFVRRWDAERDPVERAWLLVQFKRAVPELAEFIESMQKADHSGG